MKIRQVLYAAAHGGFAGQAIPLGGGAAVSNLLQAEWARTRPFDLELLGPALLGAGAPSGRDLVTFNERQYAAFCNAFREAVTTRILEENPEETAVLVNDISEGPDFARLQQAGFRLVTIYHVDVVAYIAAIYLKDRVRPATLTRWWERLGGLGGLAPDILKLIFAQQRASLLYSDSVVVPSSGMKRTLLECYPETPQFRIQVVPWGAPELSDPGADDIRAEFGVPEGAQVLVTLSRISPEKGQDLLLEALLEWERTAPPAKPIWCFICGEPAFMQGQAHMEKLRRLAARLKSIRVVFPGYVMGARKRAFFEAADLYVFPSRHESYGLTLMEALSAGLPAVALDHLGSRDILRPEFGRMISDANPRTALWREIAALLANPEERRRMGLRAAAFAAASPFSAAAARLARLLAG